MIGDHVHQVVSFFDGKDGALMIKFDNNEADASTRTVFIRTATDEDKKAQSPAYAAYLRAKAKT